MEFLKNKFKFDTKEEGDVLEKKFTFNFGTIIGSFRNIIAFIISLLVSMVKLASGATPFGFAIFAAMSESAVPLIIPWVLISVSTRIIFGTTAFIKFLVASIVFVILKSFINGENTKLNASVKVLFATAISEIIGLAMSGVLVYDALMAVYMSIITTIFYLVFAEGLPVVVNFFDKKRVFSIEQVSSAGVLLAVLFSIFSKYTFWGMTIAGIISSLIVMIMGWRKGAAVGAATRNCCGYCACSAW